MSLSGRLGLPVLAFALVAGQCTPVDTGSPYGLDAAREQLFVLESDTRIEVEGTPVRIQTIANFRQRVIDAEPGVTRVEYFIERYYSRVEGAPGGPTELAISERGIAVRTSEQGETRLDANDPGTALDLMERPLGGAAFGPDGELVEPVWVTTHPILYGVQLVDWFVFALPPLGNGAGSWNAAREVPRLGQYLLGLDLPLLLRREGRTVTSTGSLTRARLELAPEFAGALTLNQTGRAEFEPEGQLAAASLELQMRFVPESGGPVLSRHQVSIRCRQCPSDVNSPGLGADSD